MWIETEHGDLINTDHIVSISLVYETVNIIDINDNEHGVEFKRIGEAVEFYATLKKMLISTRKVEVCFSPPYGNAQSTGCSPSVCMPVRCDC